MFNRALFTFLFLTLPILASAEALRVSGTQMPAWYERGSQIHPLAPGQTLQAGDRVITGEGGKSWLIMADDALVKLGENARLDVQRVQVSSEPRTEQTSTQASTRRQTTSEETTSSVSGVMDVLIGAFRYTTAEASRYWRRDINLSLGTTATIGIRGTDLWGQVSDKKDFVVLLDGQIEITRPGEPPVIMTEPLSVYDAVPGQAGELGTVPMSAVAALAPETELDFGQGVLQENGDVRLHLASANTRRAARELVQRLAERGLPASTSSVRVRGEQYYRVTVEQLASHEDALALADRLRDGDDIVTPWVE